MSMERYLTKAEIDWILADIPLPQASVKSVAQNALKEIKHSLYQTLQSRKMKPYGLKELRGNTLNLTYRAFIQPGDHIGMTVGESSGQSVTQVNLKTFHQAGQSATVSMIDRYRLRLYLSKEQKLTISNVHLKDKFLSFDQTYEIANRFISHSVSSLLKKRGSRNGGWTLETTMAADGSIIPLETRAPWYRFADPARFANFDMNYQGPYLRLTFDSLLLFVHKISMATICDKLQRDSKGETLVCIPSPTSISQIDIYPLTASLGSQMSETFKAAADRKESVSSDNVENQASIFFQEQIIPSFDRIHIGGIEDVTIVSVERHAVLSIVRDAEVDFDTVTGIRIEGKWRLWIDQITLKIKGIPPQKLIGMLQYIGCQDIDYSKMTRISGDPDSGYIRVSFHSNPKKALTDGMRDGDTEYLLSSKPGIIPPVPELLKYGYYHTINVVGPNFRKVINHPLVDSRHTICDNPHEIFKVRGIEATRAWLEREFYDIFTGAGYSIAPRNISAIPDFMTNSGTPIPITSRGAARQQRGALADATFEDASGAIKIAATGSRKEPITNVSAAIAVGQRISSGTGAFQIRRNEAVIAEYRRLQAQRGIGDPQKQIDIPRFSRSAMDVPPFVINLLNISAEDIDHIFDDLASIPEEAPILVMGDYAQWFDIASHYFTVPENIILEDLSEEDS